MKFWTSSLPSSVIVKRAAVLGRDVPNYHRSVIHRCPAGSMRRASGGGLWPGSVPDGAVERDLDLTLVAEDGLEGRRPGGVAEPAGAAGELVGPLDGRRRDELAVEGEVELVAVGGGEDHR